MPLATLLKACLVLLLTLPQAMGQAYKWRDDKGMTHYGQHPSASFDSKPVDTQPYGPFSDEPKKCHTIRCQGERLDAEKARKAETEAKTATPVIAAPGVRGLSFEDYIRIQRGMNEGEVLLRAGPPDQITEEPAGVISHFPRFSRVATQFGGIVVFPGVVTQSIVSIGKSFYYYPTVADPFLTKITFTGGRVFEIERIKKF